MMQALSPNALSPSLRAKRSNPESHAESLDCFVARAPRNDGEGFTDFNHARAAA
jgi:hypothetical protein